MEVKTYRARSLQEALQFVRRDLGPGAAVLHTREVNSGVLGWLAGRQIEVTASASVQVPSRLPAPPPSAPHSQPRDAVPSAVTSIPAADRTDFRAKFRHDLEREAAGTNSLIEDLWRESTAKQSDLPAALFRLFTDLLAADTGEEIARELIDKLRQGAKETELGDAPLLKARLLKLLEDEFRCCGAIRVTPGQRRLVALVGPTGVGKTTTIAKLAADFRLREQCRVGLITVDTYRIAAVDQLQTYADIIDVPMEVVGTPREMRGALARFADLDLVLMDTAGRSPADDVRLHALKTMLNEARADEVHLVLSCVASATSLQRAAERFAEVGANSMILTKLDEAAGLGLLLPFLRTSRLPLSYVTHGQNVPHDIAATDRRKLARAVVSLESA